jgi:hypothetical protein
MNSNDYKQKYLKYKNKYLELKALEKSNKINQQTGGFAYAPGEYVFFIPANKADFDSQSPKDFNQKKLIDENGNILGMKGLDDLTNYLGNCTKFLRVGKSLFDLTNSYNTLYANQSSVSVIKREVNDVKVAVQPYANAAYATAKQAVGFSDVTKQNEIQTNQKSNELTGLTKNDINDSTIHSSDLENTEMDLTTETNQDSNQATNKVTNQIKVGGDGECVKIPQKLSSDLLIETQNDISEPKLQKIVEFIIKNGLQGTDLENRISRIIYVKKPLIPGKPTTIDMARNYVVNYDSDNKVSVTKK